MAKIPVNKNKNCVNLDGLIDFELEHIKRLSETERLTEKSQILYEDLRAQYCGDKCFYRHRCELSERYLR
jgi:hypothetical protein